MSKHDFTSDEFAERRRRAREAIAGAGLDWFICFHPVPIRWLTGSDAKSYQEFQCLLISAKLGPLAVLTRQGEWDEFTDDALVDEVVGWGGGEGENPIEAFAAFADRHGLRRARVGMDAPAYYLHPHHYLGVKNFLGAALIAEPNTLLHDLTLVKSPAEFAYIERATRIADEAMQVFVDHLAEGKSELALAGKVYDAILSRDGGIPASTLNLVSGERSCFSHGAPTERRLKRGDYGNIEYGPSYRRYTATIGRQFSLGPPTPRMKELYDLVLRASDACIAEMRDGVPAIVPHEAAKRVIADAGLDHGRVHTSGYGLAAGFPPTWGEPIHMLGGTTYTLRAGMVMTVEPPVFLGAEKLGARIIDNVLVTKDGAKLLSRFSRDLIVVD